MNKHILSATLSAFGIVASLLPVSGFAYIAPGDLWSGGSQAAPPTQREGEAVVAQQQKVSAERRAAEWAALNPVEPEPTVVVEKAPPKGLLDEKATYARRMERMEEDRSNGPTIIITGGNTVTDANGTVLHSGAPRITATGPESVLGFAAMFLAGICTYMYVSMRSRRMTALS